MARCGCNESCQCLLLVEDTDCIDLTVTGLGTPTNPYIISALPVLDPVTGNQLSCGPDGLFVPATEFIPGEWADWTPTLTASVVNPTLGTGGTSIGRFVQDAEGTVKGWGRIQFGTSGANAGNGNYRISLPIPAATIDMNIGPIFINDSGTIQYNAVAIANSATTFEMYSQGFGDRASNTIPMVWTNLDLIHFSFQYEGI